MTHKASKSIKFSFKEFLDSQQAGGIILIVCTIASLALANSPIQLPYLHFWEQHLGLNFQTWSFEHSLIDWVNDGLMAVFFLFVGLEIKREFVSGELSNLKVALLPVLVALGGMLVPGLFYTLANINGGHPKGFGIPMATDIAFALGALSLLGNRVPTNLKVFLMALAVIDDLGAIVVIALFYGGKFSLLYFLLSIGIFAILLLCNRLKIKSLWIYLGLGIALWYCMLHSGIHATIAGVLLALAIPFDVSYKTSAYSLPEYLVHHLHKPINFVIMPIFAIANTAIAVNIQSLNQINLPVSLGIFSGLFLGKAIGILGITYLAVKVGISSLPSGVKWIDVMGMGFLGGIGFTMSIFVTNLAFAGNNILIDNSKLVIILSSTLSGLVGYLLLKWANRV